MAAYRSGRYGDAADELSAFVRSPSAPGHLVPSGVHHLAKSYRSIGNLSASARQYDRLLSRFRSYRQRNQAMLEAAQVHMRLGSYARARSLLRQLESRPGWAAAARRELITLDQRARPRPAAGAASAVDAAEDIPAGAAESAEPGY